MMVAQEVATVERVILHCDCNNFYAAVEAVYDPSLRGKPFVVCGDPELRHGIVLSKSYEARACGIKTAEVLWEAKQKCPTLVLVPANHHKYVSFSRMMRAICRRYTPYVEAFGLDESWLDVTDHPLSGEEIAREIRQAAREELGITVSIGVSFNKVFAKLGSDMRRPDATTVISPDNFRGKVWPLPAQELLYIGRATQQRLNDMGLYTIGDIATAPLKMLRRGLGKNGQALWHAARGEDDSPVLCEEEADDIKSVSNSTTPPHDIATQQDARALLYLLSDSVAARLRGHERGCRTVSIWMRDTQLRTSQRQCRLPAVSDISDEIAGAAWSLFCDSYDWHLPLRSLGVCGSDLETIGGDSQVPLWRDHRRAKNRTLEYALDDIRGKYGHNSVRRGLMLCDPAMTEVNPVDDQATQSLAAMHGRA